MVKIVHWHSLVGRDFLSDFVKISRGLIYCRVYQKPETDIWKTVTEAAHQKYTSKREWMRLCGYSQIENRVQFFGWYRPYMEGEELRFLTTAPQPREYISVDEWKEWLRGQDIAGYEFQGTSIPEILQGMGELPKGMKSKKRYQSDPDAFTHEGPDA